MNENGLVCIQGRLRRACPPGATRNPIVLHAPAVSTHYPAPSSSNIAGPQLTLASLRHEFWILRAHVIVRSVLYKCIPCTRERADEFMNDLSAARIRRDNLDDYHALTPGIF